MRRSTLALASLAALLTATAVAAPRPKPPPDALARIAGTVMADGIAWSRLAELTDDIGPRLSGSPGAAAAVAWAVKRLQGDGLNAWTEPVMVPHWVRGEERAEITSPAIPQRRMLAVTALGGSPGSPSEGVEAEVVEVRSLEELDALGAKVAGKIVLFQHGMNLGTSGYGEASHLRGAGPARAAQLGAAAALIRSLATLSLRDPHTGATSFQQGAPEIPAAAISVEDAEQIHRLLARAPVKVRLTLGCGMGTPPEVESANVVAEIKGRELPNEVVVFGGHLDSWDLGHGAVDDGAGVVQAMDAIRAIARVGVAPRRTVRAVLFMNEENGLRGGIGYADRHGKERHVAAIESDGGAGRPLGFSASTGDGGVALLARLGAPLSALGVGRFTAGGGGADISPLRYALVPVINLDVDTTHYFDWHHSPADTLDKVDPRDLASGAAALAMMAWQLAEADQTLPAPEAPKGPPWWQRPPEPPAAAATTAK